MIKFAAQAGAIDEEKVVLESLGAIKRAGADPIFQLFRPRSGREKDPPLSRPSSVALTLTGARRPITHVGRVRHSCHQHKNGALPVAIARRRWRCAPTRLPGPQSHPACSRV